MTDSEILILNIQGNIARVQMLLQKPLIMNKEVSGLHYDVVNKDNVELRQRIKLLRKELLQLEKEMK